MKYYKNLITKIVVKGDKYNEICKRILINESGDVFSENKTQSSIILGEIIIDENNVYGLGEKMRDINCHQWEEVNLEDIEDEL